MLRPASDPGLLPGCCIGTVQIGSTINSILPAALTRLAMQAEFPGLSHSPLLCPGLSMAQLQSCSFTPRAAHCRALPAAQACLTPVPTPVTSPVLPGPLETTPALTSIGKLWENLGSSRATYLKNQQQQKKTTHTENTMQQLQVVRQEETDPQIKGTKHPLFPFSFTIRT